MAHELLVTASGIATFPNVFTAQEFEGKTTYNINLLFSEEAMKSKEMVALKKAVKEAAVEKFGKENLEKKIKAGKFTSPFSSGDDKADSSEENKLEMYRGKTIVKAKSKFQPSLIDAKRQPILSEEEFYGGCEARIAVSMYAWEYMGKVGVSLNLNHVQKTADGEKLGGGRVKAEDVFSALETEEETKDDSLDGEFDI